MKQNNLRACEHQIESGWNEAALRPVKVYTFELTSQTAADIGRLKHHILEDVKNGKSVTATPGEQQLLSLERTIKTGNPALTPDITRFYERTACDVKPCGSVLPEHHPAGLWGKRYPICGHAFGVIRLAQEKSDCV